MSFLKEEGCRIDIAKGVIEFKGRPDEVECTVPIMHMEVMNAEEDEEIEQNIDRKIDSIDCEDEELLKKLKEILLKNKNLFRECPGPVSYTHLDVYKRQKQLNMDDIIAKIY